ncbi:MAG TPA: hypothetical protein VGO93_15355 [Candidatus Xenobia bacterium]
MDRWGRVGRDRVRRDLPDRAGLARCDLPGRVDLEDLPLAWVDRLDHPKGDRPPVGRGPWDLGGRCNRVRWGLHRGADRWDLPAGHLGRARWDIQGDLARWDRPAEARWGHREARDPDLAQDRWALDPVGLPEDVPPGRRGDLLDLRRGLPGERLRIRHRLNP